MDYGSTAFKGLKLCFRSLTPSRKTLKAKGGNSTKMPRQKKIEVASPGPEAMDTRIYEKEEKKDSVTPEKGPDTPEKDTETPEKVIETPEKKETTTITTTSSKKGLSEKNGEGTPSEMEKKAPESDKKDETNGGTNLSGVSHFSQFKTHCCLSARWRAPVKHHRFDPRRGQNIFAFLKIYFFYRNHCITRFQALEKKQ